MGTSVFRYYRHRFPAQIISHCVWLYFRFSLSFRDGEEMLAMRGVIHLRNRPRMVPQVRTDLCQRLATKISANGDRWHLDEVLLKINGAFNYLWRAVDQDGEVLDILIQSLRDKKAAKKFFRKLLKGLRYVPRVIITDKLKKYNAAMTEVLLSAELPSEVSEQSRRELTSKFLVRLCAIDCSHCGEMQRQIVSVPHYSNE